MRARPSQVVEQVHPADLDDALCLSPLASTGSRGSGGGETYLPFAVEDARLQVRVGKLWSLLALHSRAALSVVLGTSSGHLLAHLEDFRLRRIRAGDTKRRPIYIVEWHAVDLTTNDREGWRAEVGSSFVLRDASLAAARCEGLSLIHI